jgi:hypothetical protein
MDSDSRNPHDEISETDRITSLLLRKHHLETMDVAYQRRPPYWWRAEHAAIVWVLETFERSMPSEYDDAERAAERLTARRSSA